MLSLSNVVSSCKEVSTMSVLAECCWLSSQHCPRLRTCNHLQGDADLRVQLSLTRTGSHPPHGVLARPAHKGTRLPCSSEAQPPTLVTQTSAYKLPVLVYTNTVHQAKIHHARRLADLPYVHMQLFYQIWLLAIGRQWGCASLRSQQQTKPA
jgi:hypothetical protein